MQDDQDDGYQFHHQPNGRESSSPPDTPPVASTTASQASQQIDRRLARILAEPEIAAALKGGELAKAHRLLEKRRKWVTDPAERVLIDQLLADRRQFAHPISRPPTLSTVDGFGLKLYGRNDVDPHDGSYVSTYWFVLLFLPIWPIRQYLLQDAGDDSHRVFATVPLSRPLRMYRRGVGATLLLAVLGVIGFFGWHSSHAKVHFVNAMDFPVTIKVGNRTVQAAAGSRATHSLAVGRYRVQVLANGRIIDEHDVDIPSGHDVVVYNVLGAAALIDEHIVYSDSEKVRNTDPGGHEVFCGDRLVARRKVHYCFVQPPSEIQTSPGKIVHKRWFHQFDGGWKEALGYLVNERQWAKALVLARGRAMARPDDLEATASACHVAFKQSGPDGAIGMARQLLDVSPDCTDLHRLYQIYMECAGRAERARQEYRQRALARPDCVASAYLAARIEPPAVAREKYARLYANHPDDVFVVRGYGWSLFQNREFAEALPVLEKLRKLDPAVASSESHLSLEVRCLIALGNRSAAAARTIAACDGLDAQALTFDHAVLAGRVLRQLAATQPEGRRWDHYLNRLMEQMPDEEARHAPRTVFNLMVGEPASAGAVQDPSLRQAIEIIDQTARDLGAAAARAGAASDEVLACLDDTILFLLAGECGVQGRRAEAERLAGLIRDITIALPSVREFLATGKELDDWRELDLSMQSAAALIRARRARAADKPFADHLEQARADDLLNTIITRVADQQFR